MRIAHLILAHKNPLQLEKMIDALDHPDFDFYVHVDKKTDIAPFLYLEKHPRIFFIRQRVKVYWACYSMVQATVNGMSEILNSGQYGYINLMSGQDFPIKSPEFIHQYFSRNSGMEFITCNEYDEKDEWWREAIVRIRHYHFQNLRIPGRYRLQDFANKILPDRKYPLEHTIVGRSQWFSITRQSAAYILDFLEKNPKVVRFFKYVWAPDELIFSTILFNSPFKSRIRPNLVYVDWSEKKPNPKLLSIEDLEKLKASDKLFARKFDLDAAPVILERLEEFTGSDTLVKTIPE
jgi:hypothetical protein